MAYTADLAALGADHHWTFDGDVADGIGAAEGTNSGGILTDGAIAEDATNCLTLNGLTDRVTLTAQTTLNSGTATRKVMGGWFQLSAIQQPFVRLYGEGNTTNFQFVIGMGNRICMEVRDGATWQVQVYSDVVIVAGRTYHVLGEFEDNANGNIVTLWVDGVRQTNSIPVSGQPNDAGLPSRTPAEFGDPAGTVSLDGATLTMVGPVNCKYQHWFNVDGASVTDVDKREEAFEKGALPTTTISSGTESVMQTALDALVNDVYANAPLCIRVNAVTGDGNLTLTSDNVTFDALASIHVQYMGTGTLTWENTNGGDASIVSTPNGGTVTIVNETTLTITDLKTGSEVRVYEAGTQTELGGVESSVSTYDLGLLTNSVDVVIHSLNYEYKRIEAVDTTADTTIVASQFFDRQYENPV